MTFERGDIQLLSNHSILHARDEFEDFDEPERKRRLLRVWLNCWTDVHSQIVLRIGLTPGREMAFKCKKARVIGCVRFRLNVVNS